MREALVKLKKKWGISRNVDFILIFAVFTVTGLSTVYLLKNFFILVGVDGGTNFWLKLTVRILFVFPVYQILTLVYATLLGQLNFFWPKQKIIGKFMLKLVTFNKNK